MLYVALLKATLWGCREEWCLAEDTVGESALPFGPHFILSLRKEQEKEKQRRSKKVVEEKKKQEEKMSKTRRVQ